MINIDFIKSNRKVLKNFGQFYSIVIDTSTYRLSKTDKRRLRELFESIDADIVNSQSFEDDLKTVLNSFDYEAARQNKVKDKRKKLKEKKKRDSAQPPRKKSGIQIIPSDAQSTWRPNEPSEVRDKSYYANLRATSGYSRDENDIRHLPRLGLGIESMVSIPRIKSDEVVIDKHTETKGSNAPKHHLYTAGWSSKGHFIDSDEETS
ncbi:hypothetical protein BK412_26055 [Vibrio campbellii]|uniref:hypothetical protein n=1 Tax=Vibrio campbellii TaxID=680 RepID=UPI0009BEFE9D|nr:hypothetical protein [Vibrio campbellii]OQP99802.1 hypothetical protein BK412_26055 [Vibrio campbellii]